MKRLEQFLKQDPVAVALLLIIISSMISVAVIGALIL